MDIRRHNPTSPRGRQGKSYHDLTAMRASSVPPTAGLSSPGKEGADGYIALPTSEDEPAPRLTMRKAHAEEGGAHGLGLDNGESAGGPSSSGPTAVSGHDREKSD